MEKIIDRLNSIDNEMSAMFSVMLINGEEPLIESVRSKYPTLLQHFIMVCRSQDDAFDLLENDNIYDNFLVGVPALMAVDPTIGFQLIKDVLKDLGFETQQEFSQWSELNPTKFLNYLRSSITLIQAYFDLGKLPDLDGNDTVVDFIFQGLAGEIIPEEQMAAVEANKKVNDYLWG